MSRILAYLTSTIGRKQSMAVAGLGLCLFVLAHAVGNLLVFKGPQAYNSYSHALISNPLIYLAEGGLLAIFLIHIVSGTVVFVRNKLSRDTRYAVVSAGEKATPMTTKTMWLQGVVVFVFVVLHLITFKFGPHYSVSYEGVEMRDIFRLLVESFQSQGYVAWYVVAVLILGAHLAHGLYSSLQTLGLSHPKYECGIRSASVAYGVFIAGVFASQPIYMHFFYKG